MTFRSWISVLSVVFVMAALGACSSKEAGSVVESQNHIEDSAQIESAVVEVAPGAADQSLPEQEVELEGDALAEDQPDPEPSIIEVSEAASVSDGLPDGLGKDEFEGICSQCHAVATAIAVRRSQAEWRTVIQEMRDLGASASDLQAGLILAYLSRNFGS